MVNSKLLVILMLMGWYFAFFNIFIAKNPQSADSPELRSRFGTILWHSSDRNGRTSEAMYDPKSVTHTYCYYPMGSTTYNNKSGEYIIKREDNGDCTGWYGAAIFHEGDWVSEKEKIWWNNNEKQEELARSQQKPTTI
jgi:hypothetical protein